MEGDAGRLAYGLLRYDAKTGPVVVQKRLRARVKVARNGKGTLGTLKLEAFPNQNGNLGRRLGGDDSLERRVPICSHVITDDLSIAGLGKQGWGLAGGLFCKDGDTLLHLVLRNAHVANRSELIDELGEQRPPSLITPDDDGEAVAGRCR